MRNVSSDLPVFSYVVGASALVRHRPSHRTPNSLGWCSLIPCVLLAALLPWAGSSVHGTDATHRRHNRQQVHPWTLPSPLPQPQSRAFFDQCMSLGDAVARLTRGGSSYQPDDWTTPAKPTNRYSGEYMNDNDMRNPYDPMQDDVEGYDDYGRAVPRRRNSGSSSSTNGLGSFVPKVLQKGDRKNGLLLLVSGISLTFLGVTLFFNKTLLRLGNLLSIAGVLLTLGPTHTVRYFAQPEKMRATACLALGIMLVLAGSPLLGIVLEVFGVLNLFGNMFPLLVVFVKQMPVIGPLLKSNNTREKTARRTSRNDYYYDDYGGGDRGYRSDSQKTTDASHHQNDHDFRDEYREDESQRRRY
jgi:Got1/Sft2-like family